MKKLIQLTLLAFAFASIGTVAGCDKPKDDKAAKTNEKAPAAKAGAKDGKDDKGGKPAVDGDKPEPAEPEADSDGDAGSGLDPKVEQAVGVANKLAAKPEDADAILEAAGMDLAAFESLLYEIAKDPELSKAYAIAREA